MNAVEFIKVSKSFGEKQILNKLSFSIAEGEILCIMAPSGWGKTTIVRLLLGLIKPDEGLITAPIKKSVVFQEDRLFEEFSALSNVCTVTKDAAAKKRCARLLSAVGLGKELKTPVRKLSGGMKRRVAIARALAADADFYVMDEPFKGLDLTTKDEVIAFVKSTLHDKTAVIVTHQEDEAKKLGARILQLDDHT